MNKRCKTNILVGDAVIVHTGKYKGVKGAVIARSGFDRLVVSNVNLAKVHLKRSNNDEGGIKMKEMSIHISNVALLDPQLDVGTKVKSVRNSDGVKQRCAKISGNIIPKPELKSKIEG